MASGWAWPQCRQAMPVMRGPWSGDAAALGGASLVVVAARGLLAVSRVTMDLRPGRGQAARGPVRTGGTLIASRGLRRVPYLAGWPAPELAPCRRRAGRLS